MTILPALDAKLVTLGVYNAIVSDNLSLKPNMTSLQFPVGKERILLQHWATRWTEYLKYNCGKGIIWTNNVWKNNTDERTHRVWNTSLCMAAVMILSMRVVISAIQCRGVRLWLATHVAMHVIVINTSSPSKPIAAYCMSNEQQPWRSLLGLRLIHYRHTAMRIVSSHSDFACMHGCCATKCFRPQANNTLVP